MECFTITGDAALIEQLRPKLAALYAKASAVRWSGLDSSGDITVEFPELPHAVGAPPDKIRESRRQGVYELVRGACDGTDLDPHSFKIELPGSWSAA